MFCFLTYINQECIIILCHVYLLSIGPLAIEACFMKIEEGAYRRLLLPAGFRTRHWPPLQSLHHYCILLATSCFQMYLVNLPGFMNLLGRIIKVIKINKQGHRILQLKENFSTHAVLPVGELRSKYGKSKPEGIFVL